MIKKQIKIRKRISQKDLGAISGGGSFYDLLKKFMPGECFAGRRKGKGNRVGVKRIKT